MEPSWRDVKQYVRWFQEAPGSPSSTAATDASSVATDASSASTYWSEIEGGDARERRASVVRNCVCGMLCALVAVAVSVCFGSALFGVSTPSRHMERVLQHVKEASVVEFTVAFKPQVSFSLQHRQHQHQHRKSQGLPRETKFYDPSVLNVSGRLFPRVSEDSGRLRFDGLVNITTNASQVHELVLANHRGYRTICELPSRKIVSEDCLGTQDIPPLHALEAIPGSAFLADEFTTFGVNCSVGNPIEMLFVDVPFVFCAAGVEYEQPIVSQPVDQSLKSLRGAHEAMDSRMLVFHGEHVTLRANLVSSNKTMKMNRALWLEDGSSGGEGDHGEDQLEANFAATWKQKAESMPVSCKYLEAPLSSGQAKRSFLYQLLPSR